jgi:hypothetical protein
MPGKLPIDRARENVDAPSVYRMEWERLTQQRARRPACGAPGVPHAARPRGVLGVRSDGEVEEVEELEQEAGHA